VNINDLVSPAGVHGGAPIIPNQGVIIGRVIAYCVVSSKTLNIEPEQTMYTITVSVESTEDIQGAHSHVKNMEGRTIVFYTREKVSSEIYNKKIRANVTIRGDERSKSYWMNDYQFLDDR